MPTKETSNFSIAVVGGGIGGLFTALSIHHHCALSSQARLVHIDVFEQANKYSEIGAGLGIGPNAGRLIYNLGLYDELKSVGGDPHDRNSGVTIRRFDNGKEIITWPKVAEHSMPIRQISCSRSAALDVFRKAIAQRGAATLHTRKQCTRVEDCGDKVAVHFADGTTNQADLVVACDGIHSAVRHQFTSNHAKYSSQIAYRDVVSCSLLSDNVLERTPSMWLGQHRHFLAYPISKGQELNVIAFVNKPDIVENISESWTTTCDRKDFAEDFQDHEETVQAIIRNVRDRPGRWRINDRDPLDKWHYMAGKVILLGDAAHAMLPHMGAGCGQAMEDGWVLGRALADYLAGVAKGESQCSTLEDAANLYQSVRLPRAHRVQAGSRVAGNTYDFQTEDLIDLAFDEGIPIVAERIRHSLRWVWNEDLDDSYETARSKLQ